MLIQNKSGYFFYWLCGAITPLGLWENTLEDSTHTHINTCTHTSTIPLPFLLNSVTTRVYRE